MANYIQKEKHDISRAALSIFTVGITAKPDLLNNEKF